MAGTGGKREGAGRKGLSDEIKGFNLAIPHVEEAFGVVVEIMKDETKRPTDRIAAAKLIIEYGCGKPKETIDQTINVNQTDIKELFNFDNTKPKI
jgi:hypothetical protein